MDVCANKTVLMDAFRMQGWTWLVGTGKNIVWLTGFAYRAGMKTINGDRKTG